MDDQRSYVTFLYVDIQWTVSTTGIRSLAGINGGDGVRSETLSGSLSENIINLETTSNVDVPGMWMCRVDASEINSPESP